jgi:RNA polymerase sigma factor (sigma-70 family)
MDETIRQNESALVCAAKSGDRDAIQRLLRQNWAWLKSLVYGIVRRVDDVDDVLQDICVKVISKISTIRDPESFRPWLACLARREAISYHRHKSRQGALLEGLDKDRIQPLGDDSRTAGAQGLEQAEQVQEVLGAVRTLPDKYREVFLLQYSQDQRIRKRKSNPV